MTIIPKQSARKLDPLLLYDKNNERNNEEKMKNKRGMEMV